MTSAPPAAGSRRAAPGGPAKRRSTRSLPAFQQLDGLRIIVVLALIFHTYQYSLAGPSSEISVLIPGSSTEMAVGAVDLLLAFFFVLGGFAVAMQLLVTSLAGKAPPPARSYLIGRLARLVPLYYVLFLLVWELRYSGMGQQWWDLAWGLSLMQAWSDNSIFATIDPAWYLSVEINFTILTAAAIIPWLRRTAAIEDAGRRARRVLAVPLLVLAGSAAWKGGLLALDVPYDAFGRWFAPPAWADLWALGMLLALGVARWLKPDRPAPKGVPLLIFIGACAWLWMLVIWNDRGTIARVVRWDLSALAMIAWMVAAMLAAPERRFARLLRSGPIQYFATLALGIFLWHAPILRGLIDFGVPLPLGSPIELLISTLALLGISALAAHAGYRLIEIPGQSLVRLHLTERQRRWHGARSVRPKVAIGDLAPGLLLERLGGVSLPAIVLVAPSHRERPLDQSDGATMALLALEIERADLAARGIGVAAFVADEPERLAARAAFDELDLPVHAASGAELAMLVGGLRQRWGDVVPRRAALLLDEHGVVADLLEDASGEDLVERAVARIREVADAESSRGRTPTV